MKYAIIEHNRVVNTVLADAQLFDNWIATDEAGPGWTYENGVFAAPVYPVIITPVLPWSKKDFMLKFTPAEYGAIKTAASANHEIDYYWTLFNVAESIDKTDPTTIAGINALETAGLLATGRAAEILS